DRVLERPDLLSTIGKSFRDLQGTTELVEIRCDGLWVQEQQTAVPADEGGRSLRPSFRLQLFAKQVQDEIEPSQWLSIRPQEIDQLLRSMPPRTVIGQVAEQ